MEDERLRDGYGLHDTESWKLRRAREDALKDDLWEASFQRILYRPFDWRAIFYADYLIERPRQRVMRHMLVGPNLGLIVPRQCKEEPGALVADTIIAHKTVSAYDINTLFPLYLYPEGRRLDGSGRLANVARRFLDLLERRVGEEPSPELVLQFVYAVLYSPAYRRRYIDLLRSDFPRIPLPPNKGAFLELAGLGAVLIDLHLLRLDRLVRPRVRFEGAGTGKLTVSEYRSSERRVVVNDQGQSFDGIEPEIWKYRIGGYQVLDRWLSARFKRTLRFDELEEFRRIAAAVGETIRVQRRIDEVWPLTS